MRIAKGLILLALAFTSSVFTLSEGRVTPLRNVATFWCVAIEGRPNLKNDIDNLCRSGAVDCRPIQPGGNCYQPNTDDFHASYLFNTYYQAHKTCNFNGDSILEQNQDLSTPTCKFVK
ncbi:Carbohydrate-binding X8 domain superfamily protein [Rhynchospora pubera]|uniref:Carbohydrate-binding X8 domain superfamily protein n=1 Tax=Rhynchospora pubera TaxID=906938 RepID=A0AAV8DE72_9POAL|nr:Carbohydrate-binding X8 domain superfamily protein [Rhynchospora pubera]